jgi:broad specificity phosphatase PhoE
LIHRLESIIIDVEQQVSPVLIVSHVSVLQLLIAYCRNFPVEKAMSIEVPMHTVLKFTPSRGGGWTETRHPLLEEEETGIASLTAVASGSDLSYLSLETPATTPIWNDAMQRKKSSPVLPKEV